MVIDPKIKLIIDAPSKDQKALQTVEKEYTDYYISKYGSSILNKGGVPAVKRKKRDQIHSFFFIRIHFIRISRLKFAKFLRT